MTWKRKPYETFRLFARTKKSDKRGSYRYADEGRPGNPRRHGETGAVYPESFNPVKIESFHLPVGTTELIDSGDEKILRNIREIAQREGVEHGSYQLRRHYGGVGFITEFRKVQIKQVKKKMKMKVGWKVVIENFEV